MTLDPDVQKLLDDVLASMPRGFRGNELVFLDPDMFGVIAIDVSDFKNWEGP
jgi:hypothetical protein